MTDTFSRRRLTPAAATPAPPRAPRHDAAVESYDLQLAILAAFFDSIANGRDDLLTSFVSAGLVSPDYPSPHGETPLLVAVRAAAPDRARAAGPGRPTPTASAGRTTSISVSAASPGPHAARRSRRPRPILELHLVAYLPARRAGALLRWRAARAREAEAARNAARGVALFVYLWRRHYDMGRWCVRQIREVPHHVERAVRGVAEAARRAPELARWMGAALQRLAVRIPGAVAVAARWAGEGLQGLMGALLGVAECAVSVLHTAAAAVVGLFGAVTLTDVRNGLVALGRAVVVDLPKALWCVVARLGDMAWDFLAALLGDLGGMLWYLGYAVVWLVRFIPKEVGKILMAAARLGFREFKIRLDPKMV
ncbi:hypothetical protein GGTG_13698 [Gaeumannomyces tritici R3-111a-1]|uniref:Uncharacterized protein n=1 Tax=Gaeumannomyces tritici (strain R3-111a-1) TaxID=644352 RepID=J3PJL2_GAET3|nr:hypothetical protein GGTG_13698 [Gaeumannomyces tritici R3-111a-1]EJT68733.1 hypothetical protein GGTG_13698 [Gaeumannomyces tritici R3-111a-1]